MTSPQVVTYITGDIGDLVAKLTEATQQINNFQATVNRSSAGAANSWRPFQANLAGAVSSTKSLVVASEEAEEAVGHMSHSALIGIGELVRGFTRLATSGQATAFSMRELSGGTARLGMALGPGAGLAGIALLVGGAMVEMFTKARNEMKKTQEQFDKSLEDLRRSGKGEELRQQGFLVQGDVTEGQRATAALSIKVEAAREKMEQLHEEVGRGSPLWKKAHDEWMKLSNEQLAAIEKRKRSEADLQEVMQKSLNVRSVLPDKGILASSSEATSPNAKVKWPMAEFLPNPEFFGAAMEQLKHMRKEAMADGKIFVRDFEEDQQALVKSNAIADQNIQKSLADVAKHNKEMLDQMKADGQKYVDDQARRWMNVFGIVQSAFSTSIDGIIRGTLTARQAWGDFMRSIVLEAASAELKMLASHAAFWLARKQITVSGVATEIAQESWAAIRFIAIKAAEAAAATWAAISGIPFVGPFLAPAMAAATLAGVLALGSSIGGGGGGGGGPSTSSTAGTTPAAGSPGNPAQYNVTIQAMDAKSFHEFAMANPTTFAKATVAGVHAGVRLPTGPGRGSS